jgi:hypothetical protein
MHKKNKFYSTYQSTSLWTERRETHIGMKRIKKTQKGGKG